MQFFIFYFCYATLAQLDLILYLFLKKKKNLIVFYTFDLSNKMWFPVSSTGKVSDGCIRDLGFNPRLHQN